MKNAHAIVVFPAGEFGLLTESSHRHWLSRSSVSSQNADKEMLISVLSMLGVPSPTAGLAALRFWGQTGQRSASWMAAADPIHLEARLRDLRIRSFPPGVIVAAEIRDLFDMLQDELGKDEGFTFSKNGVSGYLHSDRPIATATLSDRIADGHVPDRFPVTGGSEQLFHQLLGELQMLLHDHKVNIARQQAGQPMINSLWFWGGGIAPEAVARPMPDLYSADPLFNGFWASCQAPFAPFADFKDCLARSPRGFVAVAPDKPLGESFRSLQKLIGVGRLRRLTLLFRDGYAASFGRFDRFRFWRRAATPPAGNDDG